MIEKTAFYNIKYVYTKKKKEKRKWNCPQKKQLAYKY